MKYRIVKIANNGPVYESTYYLIQKRRFFGGWRTIDSEHSITTAFKTFAKHARFYEFKPEDIIAESN